jgi:hypothetical protein
MVFLKARPQLFFYKETIETLKDYEVKSNNGENMVFVSSSDTEIVMLTTKSNLQFLCQNDVQIFGDGTFQYCVGVR